MATHDEFGPRPRDWDIVGSAVLTTLPSKAERRMGMHMPMKHLQKPTPLVHSSGLKSTDPFSESEHRRVVEEGEAGLWAVDEVVTKKLSFDSHLPAVLVSIAVGQN